MIMKLRSRQSYTGEAVITSRRNTNDVNMFNGLEVTHGYECFQDLDKIKIIKNSVLKFIVDNNCYRKTIIKVVLDAISYHEKWKKQNCTDSFCTYKSPCRVHASLVIAMHICQKYNLTDEPDLIRHLFQTFYNCEKGFDRFFCFLDPLIFPFEIDSVLYPFPCQGRGGLITDKHLAVLEYMLRWTTNMTIPVEYSAFDLLRSNAGQPCFTNSTENVALVDAPLSTCRGSTPLLLTCHSMSSAAVLLLLRYGADPCRPGQVQYILSLQFQHPLYILITKLNASVFWATHNAHLDSTIREQYMERQRCNDEELKWCLRYICRAALRVPVVTAGTGVTYSNLNQTPMVYRLHHVFKGLVPDERWKSPAELTHFCRCAIRKTLKTCRQLPRGIYRLPLPNLLKEYLDLLSD